MNNGNIIAFRNHSDMLESRRELSKDLGYTIRKPLLMLEQIKFWCEQHVKKYGVYPTKTSGVVEFAIGAYTGTTWMAIHGALRAKVRGLGQNTPDSLAEFQRVTFGKPNKKRMPPLSVAKITEWVKVYKARYGKYPTRNTRDLGILPNGESWANIDSALKRGLRGLSGDTSLAEVKNKLKSS